MAYALDGFQIRPYGRLVEKLVARRERTKASKTKASKTKASKTKASKTKPPKTRPPRNTASLDHQPELVFALVAPIESDLRTTERALMKELGQFGYACHPIKLSALLPKLGPFDSLPEEPAFEHVKGHMDAGDQLRERTSNDALAVLAVNAIQAARGRKKPRPGNAYVLRSLKHPEEVETLRAIYGSLLFIISVFDSERARRDRLRVRLERENPEQAEKNAETLMRRDEHDRPNHGQDVRNTFPKADFFVNGGLDVEMQIRRFVRLVFQDHEQSPSRGEYAMAVAQVAARRSADLSRQVGAALVDADGEVQVASCNEVPRPLGGVYWDGDQPDGRDLKFGKDPNSTMGTEILREIFSSLKREKYLRKNLQSLTLTKIVRRMQKEDVLGGTRVRSLVEFGRVVHAEMNALTHAARRGIAVAGSRLYCTTFPCHVCARHLLAAGILEVFYIEPYPKSLAERLYPGAIHQATESDPSRLVFRPFSGVAPERYFEWFRFGRRKDLDGYAIPFDPATAEPRVRNPGVGYVIVENQFIKELYDKLKKLDWI